MREGGYQNACELAQISFFKVSSGKLGRVNATISHVCVRCVRLLCTYELAFHKLGAATLVMFEMEPSSLHGVASPHVFHKADTLHGIIKGGD